MPFAAPDWARTIRRLPEALRLAVAREIRLDPAREAVYQHLFLRDLARAGLEDIYHPIGAAANHSLLYLVLRTVRELPVRQVMEFGAGQTSLLLDGLARLPGADLQITSIEHDAGWAGRIGGQVGFPIRQAPLTGPGGFYELDGMDLPVPDLVIVDGPPAGTRATRHARLGAAAALAGLLGREFIVILDDAERAGEALAARHLAAALRRRGLQVTETSVKAAKQQIVLCSPHFRAASMF